MRITSVKAPLEQFAEAALCHPFRAVEMGAVDLSGAGFIMSGIEVEQHLRYLSPIGTLGVGIEQTDIELQMRLIVGGQRRAARWLVEKFGLGHNIPRKRGVSILEVIVNADLIVIMTQVVDARRRAKAAIC